MTVRRQIGTTVLACFIAALGASAAQAQSINGCEFQPHTVCQNDYLSGANFPGVDVTDSDFSGSDLSSSNLPGAHFNGATLNGTNFGGTNLFEADLTAAYAPGGANFTQAILARANLTQISAQSAIMAQTNLRRAMLNGADLTGANLRRADFTNADLTGATLTGASFCQTTMPDGSTRSDSKGCNPASSAVRSKSTGAVTRVLTGGDDAGGGAKAVSEKSGPTVERTGLR